MDILSAINNSVIKKPRKTKKKLEDFKIISPTSPLKYQIKEALKPEIDLLSNQSPKIIIVDKEVKTRKIKSKALKEEKPKKVTKKKTKNNL